MDTKNNNTNEYLKTRVLTASPEQLQLMLYDGAIRFCEQGRAAINAGEIENSFNLLGKAEKIVMELNSSMRDELAPETCDRMRSLYLFCYDRIVTANFKKEIDPLEEALQVLRHMRETWIMLMDKLQEEKTQEESSPQVADTDFSPAPAAEDPFQQHVGATINFEG